MGIQVAWGDTAQTHVLITFERPWNWDDFQIAIQQMVALANTINHKTNLILDIRQAGFPPEGAVNHFKKVADVQHPNIDQVVYVAPRLLAGFIKSINQMLAAVLSSYTPPDFVFVPTLEEACALIAAKAPTQTPAVGK
ncbi:MAG TPA: hypothetical protein VHO69_18235 [Phototrophicaceae bacterium]|nr:hypothetical protein [Phototrophicaceae bacterium]